MLSFLMVAVFCGCEEKPLPKPDAYLALEYGKQTYEQYSPDCPYSFSIPQDANVNRGNSCNPTITYPKMDAKVFLSYRRVDNNLRQLLRDGQKLAYEHTGKADAITENPFVNPDEGVYGMFYQIEGDAATNSQFYATDSTNHFLTGSLYFDRTPNYDSLYPAVKHIQEDMRKMMETLEWR